MQYFACLVAMWSGIALTT